MIPGDAKTNNKRQAAFKERKRAAGLVQIAVWVHRDDKARALKYIAGLNRDRIRSTA